jgi:hypothetical protein
VAINVVINPTAHVNVYNEKGSLWK